MHAVVTCYFREVRLGTDFLLSFNVCQDLQFFRQSECLAFSIHFACFIGERFRDVIVVNFDVRMKLSQTEIWNNSSIVRDSTNKRS